MSGFVSTSYALQTHNESPRREVRRLDMLHQAFDIDLRIINISHATVDYLAQVMGRHIRGHTHGDTRRTIDQEVGDARRQNGRFLQLIVEVVLHIYRFLIQIEHHGFAHKAHARFRITHSSRRVAIDRTKVSLSVH